MAQETKANLFARLTKLFRAGGPVVKRKVRGQDTRVAARDPIRSSGASLFAKSYSNVYNTIVQNAYNMGERLHRYQDFTEMELTAEISAALDLYADETVAQDDKGRTLHVYSNNPKIKEILEDLFYNVLNSEFNLRMWTRHLVKYGDLFLYNDIHPQYGILNVVPIPVAEIERLEGYDKENPMAVKFKWITVGQRELEDWEVTHVRMLGNDMHLPYGTSVLDAARKIWRQLILAEDAMLVYRLTRAPDRRVFKIDVGNAPPDQVENIMNQAKMGLRTSSVIDRSTGKIDIRNNQMSVDEDFWLAVRGSQTGTSIDNLQGGQNTAAVEDIQYLQRKLFAALKVPKAYLGFDEMLSSKATLAQEDIRFSRSINMIQRTLISELNKIAIIHLFAHGYDNEELLDFSLKLSNPSTVAQQQKLELYRTKFEIAANAPEGLLSRNYMLKQVLSMSDEEIERNRQELVEDKLFQTQLDAVAPEGGDEGDSADTDAGGAAGGGGGLFDDGGDEEAPEGKEDSGDAGDEEINAGEDPEEDEPQLDLLTAGDDGDEPIRLNINLQEKDKPIKASNKSRPKQQWKEKYNLARRRTSGRGGKDALHMSSGGNPSKTARSDDPYDFKSLKTANPLKFDESLQEINDVIQEQRSIVRPSLPNDMRNMLRRAATKWGMVAHQQRAAKLISEEVSGDELDINIEKDE